MKDQLSSIYVRSSALDPAGPEAQAIFELTSWMTWVFTAVFIIVMIFLIFGIFAKEKSEDNKPPLGNKWFILGGGVILPAVILSVLLVYTLLLTAGIHRQGDIQIDVTGYMWWWDVQYPTEGITIANEIYIPVGQKVNIKLRSKDVIHSLWIPSLAGKMDLIPGHTNSFSIEASEAGVYRGQCAEYCGLQHARMSLNIIALEASEYRVWIESKKAPRPQHDFSQAGLKLFTEVGCAECHAIKGTSASAVIGPDLTHLGSRLSLGAGTVANSKGNLAGWIANPQALKPGNKMPRTYLKPNELHLLVDYLMSLK